MKFRHAKEMEGRSEYRTYFLVIFFLCFIALIFAAKKKKKSDGCQKKTERFT